MTGGRWGYHLSARPVIPINFHHIGDRPPKSRAKGSPRVVMYVVTYPLKPDCHLMVLGRPAVSCDLIQHSGCDGVEASEAGVGHLTVG